MRRQAEVKGDDFEEIQYIVFKVMGIKLGIDVEEISAIHQFDQIGKKNIDIHWFHERIPFRKERVSYKLPQVIFIKGNGIPRGVIVDTLEDIVSVQIEAVHPLPPLIVRLNKFPALWGVTIQNGEMVFLIDLQKLLP